MLFLSGKQKISLFTFYVSLTYNPLDNYLESGDIAYDNAMESCYYTWDYVLWTFEKTTQQLGYLIPIIYSIGNHDIGLNPLSEKTQKVTPWGPAYFTYFPQHLDLET